MEETKKYLKTLGRRLLGFVMILVGIQLLVLPGPGTLFILGGVIVLGEGTAWGRRLRWKLLRAYVRIRNRTKERRSG